MRPTQIGAGGRRPVPDPVTLPNFGSCRLRFPNLSIKNSSEPRNHLELGRNLVVNGNAIALMKLDLMSPTVGANCHGFESGGAHGCYEQWNMRDTRV
jgi:hypothetical protein